RRIHLVRVHRPTGRQDKHHTEAPHSRRTYLARREQVNCCVLAERSELVAANVGNHRTRKSADELTRRFVDEPAICEALLRARNQYFGLREHRRVAVDEHLPHVSLRTDRSAHAGRRTYEADWLAAQRRRRGWT